jgi:hypothetical protein
MRILSLFDWISCWMIALECAWIKVDTYYASEIDKYAPDYWGRYIKNEWWVIEAVILWDAW